MTAIHYTVYGANILVILFTSLYNLMFLRRVQHIEEGINIDPPQSITKTTRYILAASTMLIIFFLLLLLLPFP